MPNFDLDLILIYEERTGDILFLIGTILAILSSYQAEQSIIAKIMRIPLINHNSAKTLAVASWLFFIASIIFAHVAITRFVQLSKPHSRTSPFFLKGSKYTAVGNIIKSVGFGIAAVGNQLKASSLSQTTAISQ